MIYLVVCNFDRLEVRVHPPGVPANQNVVQSLDTAVLLKKTKNESGMTRISNEHSYRNYSPVDLSPFLLFVDLIDGSLVDIRISSLRGVPVLFVN